MSYDVIVFPVIDWSFRLQRPQQIAMEMARRGRRVFYLTIEFAAASCKRPYLFWDSPSLNVFVIQLRCPEPHPNIYTRLPTPEQKSALVEALDALRSSCRGAFSVSIVDYPSWRQTAASLSDNIVIYDCMDFHAGWDFHDSERVMLSEEERLVRDADIVVTSSAGLSDIVGRVRSNVLIRNACDPDHFAQPGRVRRLSSAPVVGYVGAINHWFDMDLVRMAAHAYPEWQFILIGGTQGSDTTAARHQSNIRFLGEVPYDLLPEYVAGFDVCMIPFQIIDLTLHTNPVKLYEYLAAGKPVVGTAMPEIMVPGAGMAYVGQSHQDFIAKLGMAMADRDRPELVARRVEFAKKQTWADRVDQLEAAIARVAPRASGKVSTL